MAYSLKYTLNSSTNTYSVTGWSGIATSDNVVIPSTYNGKSVTSIGSYAFQDCTNLKSIAIPASITNIDVGAFYRCTSLTNVAMRKGVKSIGNVAFYGCSNLTIIAIPDSVTLISNSAFSTCSNLTNVTIGSSITNIDDYAFYKCSSLTTMVLLSTTPPTLVNSNSGTIPTTITNIYVPRNSVNLYKTATNWSRFASKINYREPLIVINKGSSTSNYSRLKEWRLNGKTSNGSTYSNALVKQVNVVSGGNTYTIFRAVDSIIGPGNYSVNYTTSTLSLSFRVNPLTATGISSSNFSFTFSERIYASSTSGTSLATSSVIVGTPSFSAGYLKFTVNPQRVSEGNYLFITVTDTISRYSATIHIYREIDSSGGDSTGS